MVISLASQWEQTLNVVETYQRIKLVNPDVRTIEKGYDGLFRSRNGAILEMDEAVALQSGMLEASNVNLSKN